MADLFLSDTQAPSLGLYLTKTSNGIAYSVVREIDGEHLFTGGRGQVRLFLRGYEIALGHPALVALNKAIDDEEAGNGRVLDCAIKVANIPAGGVA